jgi:hypothetical protein
MQLLFRLFATAALITAISVTNVFAQQSNCKSIQDPKARLECFDTSPIVQPKATADPRTEGNSLPKEKVNTTMQGGWQVTTDQGWQLHRRNDPMTDKPQCFLAPVGKGYAQFTTDAFYISYKGRGGVQGYNYRLDDRPVAKFQIATEMERKLDVIEFSDDAFKSVLGASRLRLEVLTVLREVSYDDFALVGMRGLFAKMSRECPG